MSSFQASSTAQGKQFAAQCDLLLTNYGFTLQGVLMVRDVGVEIDRVAQSPRGATIWFEYKGSLQGSRPGLMRTDTLKKAVANGALLAGIEQHPPFIVLTSHLPTKGSGLAMLESALRLGFFDDVICVYEPDHAVRLEAL